MADSELMQPLHEVEIEPVGSLDHIQHDINIGGLSDDFDGKVRPVFGNCFESFSSFSEPVNLDDSFITNWKDQDSLYEPSVPEVLIDTTTTTPITYPKKKKSNGLFASPSYHPLAHFICSIIE